MVEENESLQEAPRERPPWLWVIIAVTIGYLLVADIALYSMYRALQSRVEGQDHRLSRLQQMVLEMIKVNRNAEKIEKIETQVDAIGVQVSDMTTSLTQEPLEPGPVPPTSKKSR